MKYIFNSLKEGVFPALYKQTLIKPKLRRHSLDKDILSKSLSQIIGENEWRRDGTLLMKQLHCTCYI